MIFQIFRPFGTPEAVEIGGRGRSDEAERAGEADRDHIGIERFAHPDAGIEAPGAQVGERIVGIDFQLDLGIGVDEARDDRFEHRLHRAAHQVDAQPPRRTVTQVARRVIGVGQPGKGRCGAFEEHFARLRQPDAARRPHEQRSADARFQRLDRLADRRGRYP